jgi:hypothetical protein
MYGERAKESHNPQLLCEQTPINNHLTIRKYEYQYNLRFWVGDATASKYPARCQMPHARSQMR